ncbi:MAG: sigma-70 family RNA polymerase sigma factor [Bacteroidales bacterium]|nr:sigma-70 family RNA polymerase sigma factor [Bacteroidales bacterium]
MEGKYINVHQDLINACLNGDRNAQFRIYKLYYKAMYNTSLRIVNDTAEAEDIMQESFLDAFERLHSYTGEGSFGSWLKRIVINRSLDYLRKCKETVYIDEVAYELLDNVEEDREEEIQCRVAEIRMAITQLSDEYRVVLSLFLLEGYDHEEIAQILNISNQLSRTRYSRARQKLIGLLKQNSYNKMFSTN